MPIQLTLTDAAHPTLQTMNERQMFEAALRSWLLDRARALREDEIRVVARRQVVAVGELRGLTLTVDEKGRVRQDLDAMMFAPGHPVRDAVVGMPVHGSSRNPVRYISE